MGIPSEPEPGGRSSRGSDLSEESLAGKIVVLGLGNPYMKDDGVGILVARELRRRDLGEDAVFQESLTLDASLIWQFREAAALVIIDALKSGAPVGKVSRFTIAPRSSPITDVPSLHEMQLHDLVDLAGMNLVSFPVTVVAVEPKDCSLGEGLTAEIQRALPKAVDEVVKLLREISKKNATDG